MNKIIPTVVLIGLSAGIAGFLLTQNNVEAQLKAQAESINKSLPKVLNPNTRYEKMLVDGRRVNHIYTLTQVTADQVQEANLKQGYEILRNIVCSDKDSQYYLDNEVKFSFTYKDKLGKFVRVFSLSKEDCPSA